jgi:hypothetical protein
MYINTKWLVFTLVAPQCQSAARSGTDQVIPNGQHGFCAFCLLFSKSELFSNFFVFANDKKKCIGLRQKLFFWFLKKQRPRSKNNNQSVRTLKAMLEKSACIFA